MKAVIPAAGEGTRLRPLTADRPKPLVDVAGQPLLAHVLDQLESIGIDEAIVVIGYNGEMIVEAFGRAYGTISITYVEQPERRGLADAVHRAADLIDEHFLVLNGDNVFLEEIGATMPEFHEIHPDGALLVERGSPSEVAQGGAVQVSDGTVVDVVEKPDEPQTPYMTTGCYFLPAAIMDACAAIEPSARGELELSDAISRLIQAGHRFVPVTYPGWRRNVNTPDDIAAVESRL